MTWVYDDGGRKASGYRGEAGDCVTRAVAIATGENYESVYASLNESCAGARLRGKKISSRTGIKPEITRRYLAARGWRWTPTMRIGSGCKVHLLASELPAGRIICKVTRHLVAVIDGVIHDTHDCSRGGTRCVYGYWTKGAA